MDMDGRLASTLAVDGMPFPNDVLIESCALSAMNMEPQTLDEAIYVTDEEVQQL